MKTNRWLAAMLCATASFPLYAGTCASPTPMPPPPPKATSVSVSGNTCGGEAGINMGGTIYGHPSQVYRFRANNLAGAFTLSGGDREMSITTSCTSAPVASGAPGVPIPAAVLTSGTEYLLIVSTDPSIPLANPPICGDFTTMGPFPVSLQTFSVD